MENDIVERLRAKRHDEDTWAPDRILFDAAADEVERLRECNKELRAAAKAFLRELGRDIEQYEEHHEEPHGKE